MFPEYSGVQLSSANPARMFAVVPAAGSGTRFGTTVPKQYQTLAGRSMLYHSLAALLAEPRIERVYVVLHPADVWFGAQDWGEHATRVISVHAGGATRAASVLAGLLAARADYAPTDWALVHDAARPCLSRQALVRLIDAIADDPVGGLLALPMSDTVKRADGEWRVLRTEPREHLWRAQTPQMFRLGLLIEALQGESAQRATDEAAAVEAGGLRPLLVPGDPVNLKVTLAPDLEFANWLLSRSTRELN